MPNSIRSQIAAIYAASGYAIVNDPNSMLIEASRTDGDGNRQDVAIALPLELSTPPSAQDVLAAIQAWRPAGDDRIFVVALPKLLSHYGADFLKAVSATGGRPRYYAGVLDGGFGGDYIGLGTANAKVNEFRRSLVDYSRLDGDLLAAVIRPNLEKRASAEVPTRVQQRYFIRSGASIADRRPTEGVDLLHHLIARLGQAPTGLEVFLVIGPGGAGKSWLFEGLFTYLDEAFQSRKQRQEDGVRPVPVMPQSLIVAGSRTADDLFSAVGATEFGAAGAGLLEHQVRTGRSLLMFDGLDEFFADNHDVADAIARRFATPTSRARIFIVLRDSLLETSHNVKAMVERFQLDLEPGSFGIYEIAEWQPDYAQRELAWLKLEQRRPRPGEVDTAEVIAFRQWLAGSERLSELAKLAFYCDLLADLYIEQRSGHEVEQRSHRQMPQDEYEVLAICFDLIVDRELAKQRPDAEQVPELAFLPSTPHAAPGNTAEPGEVVGAYWWKAVQQWIASGISAASAGPDRKLAGDVIIASESAGGDAHLAKGRVALVGLIEEAAYFSRRHNIAGPLTAENLRQLYQTADIGIDADDRILGERMLRQFVLFVQGRQPGTVDFAHEFMADFLAARHVVKLVKQGKGKLAALMGTPVGGETDVFSGYLDRELGPKKG